MPGNTSWTVETRFENVSCEKYKVEFNLFYLTDANWVLEYPGTRIKYSKIRVLENVVKSRVTYTGTRYSTMESLVTTKEVFS